MYRIAISGHRGLPTPTARLVDQAIRAALAERAPDVTGLSCLADGADQIFARAVTDLGGTLEVIVPAAGYRPGLPADSHPGCDVDTCYSFLLPPDSSVAQVVGSRHIVSAAEHSFRREPARTTSHREA